MAPPKAIDRTPLTQAQVSGALLPWIIVCVVLLIWGTGGSRAGRTQIFIWNYPVPELHNMINKVPPVVAKPTQGKRVFGFTLLSFTGTGMLIAAIISGFIMGHVARQDRLRNMAAPSSSARYSLITISAMLAIGTLTRLSGVDATLGLAFAATGVLYPFFGTLLGWLGVALTGSDTASNVLFGNLQKITSEQLGLSPILMAAANSSGGVMGKMIDAQSIVVASTATNWVGHEGSILRYVFGHSIVLACLVGVLRHVAGLCVSVHGDGLEITDRFGPQTDKIPAADRSRGFFHDRQLMQRPTGQSDAAREHDRFRAKWLRFA